MPRKQPTQQVIFTIHSKIKLKEISSERAQIKIGMRGCKSKSHNTRTCKENGN